MKTVFNTKIHKFMKNYSKYICAFILLMGMSVNAWGLTLQFDFTSNISGWPTATGSSEASKTYTLDGTAYTFLLGGNVYCNSGYLMLRSTTYLGLPAISGKVLTGVSICNSSGCSTSTKVEVASSKSGADVTGGAAQTFSKTSYAYDYSLSGTSANTMYYLYVTSANCQITKLMLTYENSSAYKVTYDAENGTCSKDDDTEDSANAGVTLPTATSNVSGWEFAGWATATCDETTTAPRLYLAGETYYPDEAITLHAVYRKMTDGTSTSTATFTASTLSGLTNISKDPYVKYWWLHTSSGVEFYIKAYGLYSSNFNLDDSGGDGWALLDAHRRIKEVVFTARYSDEVLDDIAAYDDGSVSVNTDGTKQTVTCSGNVTQLMMVAPSGEESYISSILVTYYDTKFNSNPCGNIVTLSKGTKSNVSSIEFSSDDVQTCSSTAANRQVTVTVTTNTGYKMDGDLGFSKTGTVTATKNSGPTGSGPYTYVYEFNQNDNGTATFSATATAKTYTVTLNGNGATSAGSPATVTATYNSNSLSTSITNPSKTGYTFAGWNTKSDGTGYDVISTSGTLNASQSGYTDASSNWIKDADVELYAKWTINKYKVTLASPTTVTISATSPSIAEGAYAEVNYNSTVTLAYSSLVEGRQWSGWKVTKDADATNVTASVVSTNTLTVPAYDVTVTADTYGEFVFSCAELTLTPVLATTGTPIFITSAASKTVRSQDKIQITGSGLTPSTTLTFALSDPTLATKFAIKKADGSALATDASGAIEEDAYIFYTPGSGDTSDGLDKLEWITVSVGGDKPITKKLTQSIIGRHLPADFVIAVKHTDNQWYALPADMSGTGNPAPVAIRVDNTSSPTTAYCDNTNAYSLYASTANNKSVQLAMPNNPNMANAALWANNADKSTNIGKNGNTNGSSTGLGGNYQWLFTQIATSVNGIGDVKYTMSNPNNANPLKVWTNAGSTLWGLYSSGSAEIRLLSLVDVKPMTMKVMEWGTNAIVVSYPNGGSATSPQVQIGYGDPSDVTLTSLGGDIYKVATISGLQDNPAKTLTITATESGTGKQALFPIPLIVTTAKTEAELRTAAGSNDIAKLTDVIIRDGGRMTTGTASGNFNDIYIYPGGKAKITKNFIANNIYMRGGYSFLDEKATFKYPDLCVEDDGLSTTTIDLPAANKLYYDFYIDNRKYYMFSMPQDVTLASVTDEAGNDDFPVWVKHYDGGIRASGRGVSGWAWYGDEEGQGSFFAGIGYEITAKPKTSGRPIAIIRFPVITGDITTDASNSPEVTVTYHGKSAYEAGTQTANNVGWNFIGNPYLTEYKAVTDTGMIVKSDFVEHKENDQWDGSYEWKVTKARFITVPYDTYNDYHHELVKGYTIPAFSTFFFQFAEDATGTFHMGGDRPQAALAPARFGAAPEAKPEINIDVMLRGEDELEGKAGLIIHEKYEGGLKDFEDVEQWFVDNNVLKTYTFANNVALAYNLLNEEAATELIPMGYIATVAGQHTYALNEENDVSALEHLWLIDYSTGVTTDLLVRDYSFITAAGRFDSRFAINAVLKQEEVATNISNTAGGDWTKNIGVYNDGNMLTLRGLPDNSAVYIYDMNGRLLLNGENLSSVASFSIATQGVYNIRVIAEGKAITLRTVIR